MSSSTGELSDSKKRKRERNKAKGKELRQRKRLEEASNLQPKAGRSGVSEKYVRHAEALGQRLQTEKLRVAQGAYVGIRDAKADRNKRTLEELVDEDGPYRMFYHAWDGKYVARTYLYASANVRSRQTYLILDNKTGRVVCVLACPPDDPTWEDTHTSAADYLKKNGSKCSYPSRKDKKTGEIKIPRRGDFGALACGISHGSGQTVSVKSLQKAL